MAEKVAIVGARALKAEPARKNIYYTELLFENNYSFLSEIGMNWDDMESIVETGCDVADGRSISNVFTVDAAGGHMKEETKVEEDMGIGLAYAYMRVASGKMGNSMLCSYGKGSEMPDPHFFHGLSSEPIFMKPMGLDELSIAALQATAYMNKFGLTERAGAIMAELDLANVALNPLALESRRKKFTVDDILNSKMLSTPITELEFITVSDGACCMMLTNEDQATKYSDVPVWIEGIGMCNDLFYPGHRDLADTKAISKACERALKMAGCSIDDIDLIEIYAHSSWQELMVLEALGFSEQGKAAADVESGKFALGGKLPVNPSGGALGANVWISAGGTRVAEAVWQLQGKAGDHQVKDAKKAMVYILGGTGLMCNAVYVLGR